MWDRVLRANHVLCPPLLGVAMQLERDRDSGVASQDALASLLSTALFALYSVLLIWKSIMAGLAQLSILRFD